MSAILYVFLFLSSFLLVVFVLLQPSKSSGVGASFGGGSNQTMFGSSGAVNFLEKGTVIFAIIFMLSAIMLGMSEGKSQSSSIMESVKQKKIETPVKTAAPAASGQSKEFKVTMPPADKGAAKQSKEFKVTPPAIPPSKGTKVTVPPVAAKAPATQQGQAKTGVPAPAKMSK